MARDARDTFIKDWGEKRTSKLNQGQEKIGGQVINNKDIQGKKKKKKKERKPKWAWKFS